MSKIGIASCSHYARIASSLTMADAYHILLDYRKGRL